MKVLNLIIKQKYFDAILAGRKVQEFREVRPTTVKKYIELDEDEFEKEDECRQRYSLSRGCWRTYRNIC